jgi:hypothetical protein
MTRSLFDDDADSVEAIVADLGLTSDTAKTSLFDDGGNASSLELAIDGAMIFRPGTVIMTGRCSGGGDTQTGGGGTQA